MHAAERRISCGAREPVRGGDLSQRQRAPVQGEYNSTESMSLRLAWIRGDGLRERLGDGVGYVVLDSRPG